MKASEKREAVRASERLRELNEATKDLLPTLNYYCGPGARTAVSRESVQMYYATKAARNALPLIADCIEATEELCNGSWPPGRFPKVERTLVALKEALDGGS